MPTSMMNPDRARNAAVAFAAGLLLLCFSTGSATAKQDEKKPDDPAAAAAAKVTLRVAFKEGQKDRYRSVATVSGAALGGGEALETLVAEETVTTVKDKAATVETRFAEYKITFNGMDVGAPPASAFPVVAVTSDERANLSGYKIVSGAFPESLDPAVQEAMAYAATLALPEKPVAPGETWTVELDNRMVSGKKYSMTLTYVGRETLGGKMADKIKQVYAIPTADGGTLKGDMTVYLEAGTGRKLKLAGTFDGVPTKMFGALTIRVEQTLVEPTPDAKPDAAAAKP